MIDWRKLQLSKKAASNSLLGLAFDGSRLDVAWLKRTNGSLEMRASTGVSLSIDPLTAEVELAGREIRKQLDAAGIKERWCVVCLPLKWALSLTIKLPDLPEADVESFLQIEAEKGFPYSPDQLMLSYSRYRSPGGEAFVTIIAVPRENVNRLESVLSAAQLRPASFSLGICALQPADPKSPQGVVALVPGVDSLAMQITCGGGVSVLRTVDGAFEQTGASQELRTDQVARDLRITLGQLQRDVRESLTTVRVFGRNDTATELAEQIRSKVEQLGLRLDHVRQYPPGEFPVQIPTGAVVSPAFSLAARHLSGARAAMEFLPPKINPWKQFADRYVSGKLAQAGAVAGGLAAIVAIAFGIQQGMLMYWRSKWQGLKPKYEELDKMQQLTRKYRPWCDHTFRSLAILKRLTEAFPEDGAVSAKSLEIRDPLTITCSGTARNNDALLRTLDKLRATREVSELQLEQTRGTAPLEFTFNFHWDDHPGQ